MKEKGLKTSNAKAITLIALIITIIVMLILVGVTVSIAINGGLFVNANKAKTDTQNALNSENELSEGKVNIDGKIYNSMDEYLGTAQEGGGTETGDYKSVSELFDANGKDENAEGYDPNKLHIGDFINYDAGTWTEDEINAIKTGIKGGETTANGSNTDVPNQDFQFGGFTKNNSRDKNANSTDDNYNFAKFTDNEDISGWRLFDVDIRKKTITLISAGFPEDYKVPTFSTNNGKGGYISEYILTGNINSLVSESSDIETNYTKREWNIYVNEIQHATKAQPITKNILDLWYKHYMSVSDADTEDDETFQKIYKTRYENLIDCYAYYWIASSVDQGDLMYYVNPDGRYLGEDDSACGVRVLVTLSSDVQLARNGEKTVKNIAGDSNRSDKSYTYNMWNIK